MSTIAHAREVIIIPADERIDLYKRKHRQLRVASYSRVSTDMDDQLKSFHAQKTYYTDLIRKNSDWSLSGIYADEGISGASAKKRPDFMRMIEHCKKGKIDLIITKSMSRFARNTLDSIGYIRQLKALGVGIIFEKENINTLYETNEMILTIFSGIAQEELRSTSANVKMGKQMAMKAGKVHFNYAAAYGYEKGPDNTPQIVAEQAEVVIRLYKHFLAGDSVKTLANKLNIENVPAPKNKRQWSNSQIVSILTHERYCGDIIMQKTYIDDPISKVVKVNNGDLPKVWVKNNHPAIVSREVYNAVQQERARRSSKRKSSKTASTESGKYSSLYALSEIVICGHCCSPYRRTVWTKRDKSKQAVWRCISRLDDGLKHCNESITVDEESLHKAIVQAIAATAEQRQNLIPLLAAELKESLWKQEDGQIDAVKVEWRISMLKEKTMDIMKKSIESGTLAENEDELKSLSDEMRNLHDMLVAYRTANDTEQNITTHLADITDFLEDDSQNSDGYNDKLVRQLIHTIKIISTDTIRIYFKNGLEYEQEIHLNVRQLKRKN